MAAVNALLPRKVAALSTCGPGVGGGQGLLGHPEADAILRLRVGRDHPAHRRRPAKSGRAARAVRERLPGTSWHRFDYQRRVAKDRTTDHHQQPLHRREMVYRCTRLF